MNQNELEKAAAAAMRGDAKPAAATASDIESLRREIQAAKRDRSRLLMEKATLHNKFRITTVGNKVAAARNDLSRRNAKLTTDDALLKRTKARKTAEALASFRLAGISCFSVGGRPLDIGFRFDSTFGVSLPHSHANANTQHTGPIVG